MRSAREGFAPSRYLTPPSTSALSAQTRHTSDLIPAWAQSVFSIYHTIVDGEPVSYLSGGDGPDLLLIHGLSASMDWWQHNATEFAEYFTVTMIDLPGFGRMGDRPTTGSMRQYTDWVRKFIDAAGLTRSHVMGHSMGGHIAARLAAGVPERVDRLVLIAPAGVLPDAEIEHYILPVVKLLREIPPRMLPLALRDIRRADLRTVWRTGQDLVEHDVIALLPDVQAPTLLVWGDEDPIIPLELADTFLERLPEARLLTLAGSGHLPMVDQPELFNEPVIRFLLGDQD